MQERRPDDHSPEFITALMLSMGLALFGILVQATLRPEEPAWGFYEEVGFVMALVPWVGLWLFKAVDRLSR